MHTAEQFVYSPKNCNPKTQHAHNKILCMSCTINNAWNRNCIISSGKSRTFSADSNRDSTRNSMKLATAAHFPSKIYAYCNEFNTLWVCTHTLNRKSYTVFARTMEVRAKTTHASNKKVAALCTSNCALSIVRPTLFNNCWFFVWSPITYLRKPTHRRQNVSLFWIYWGQT